jgi:FeS assembly SUF system protein
VLGSILNPEIPVDIYEVGLIYDVDADAAGNVAIRMTLTSPKCPVAESLPVEVETKVRALPGVTCVEVEIVWEPPWDPAMVSEAARLELGML